MKKDLKKIKRIGIDARFYGPIGKGLGRYTQEIVDGVTKIDLDNEYVVFLGKENFKEFESQNKKVKKVLVNARWYTLKEQIIMPWLFWRENLDLVHIPHFNVPLLTSKKTIVTIHDLILLRFPTARATTLGPLLYEIKNAAYKLVIWSAIKRAQKVIAVSKFTKKDIINYFKIKKEKIEVIYEGVADLSRGRDSIFAEKINDKDTFLGYNKNKPFLLYVGNAYPHKNLEGLVKVFFEIHKKRPDLRLVLVGKEDYFYQRIKLLASNLRIYDENSKNSLVFFPGYVPDAKLEILFKKALAYVFPSFYEGFGLPPLEAMAKGCPVVSSNKTSMPELYEDSVIYFNPENKKDMLTKIELVINNNDLQQKLIKRGFNQIKKYNWWEATQKTFEVYKKELQ